MGCDLRGGRVTEPALVFLISSEAADLMRISRRTLERMRVDGTGPRYIKAGPGKRSRVLYRQSEIVAWLEKRSYGSTSEYPTSSS
jgi:predicted DNA-binding transcriptional regulator AlpA